MPPDDGRTYVRLHDGMPENPKVVGLSDAAFRLYVEALCYCSRNLTDGTVPDAVMQRLGTKRAVAELEKAGLVEPAGGDWRVHDYLRHQRSAAEVRAFVEQRRIAGKAGADARWKRGTTRTDGEMPSEPHSESHGEPHAKAMAGAMADRMANGMRSACDRDGKPMAEAVTEAVTGEVPNFLPAPSAQATPARQRQGTRLPDDWLPSEALLGWAAEHAPHVDVRVETTRFVNFWLAKPGQGARKLDWGRTWQNWLLKAESDAPSVNGRGLAAVPDWEWPS